MDYFKFQSIIKSSLLLLPRSQLDTLIGVNGDRIDCSLQLVQVTGEAGCDPFVISKANSFIFILFGSHS
jgi:hypothetical protein